MSLTGFTAFTGELCLYMSTAGFFLSGPGGIQRMLVCAAVSLLTESICALCSNWRGAARYLPVLLMLPLFLTAGSIGAALLPVPILLLILLRCSAGEWRAEYYTVRKLFAVGGTIYAILLLSHALSENLERLVSDSLPFFAAWLLLSVLNMRLLRNQYAPSLDGRFKALNIALILCVALIGLALSSDLPVAAVTAVLRAAWVYVAWPILFAVLYAVAMLFTGVVYLAGRLLLALGIGDEAIEPLQFDTEFVQDVFGGAAVGTDDPSRWPARVAAAVGILLFLTIAWLIVRELISRPGAASDISGEVKRESLPSAARHPRRSRRRAAAEGVRAVYRKYLALCETLHIPVDGSAASDVIRDKSAPYVGREDAEALREMWLAARFSGRDASPEDTSRARRLLRRMREASAKAGRKR